MKKPLNYFGLAFDPIIIGKKTSKRVREVR